MLYVPYSTYGTFEVHRYMYIGSEGKDVYKRQKCTPYNSKFYSAIEEIVYLRLLKSNYAEYICRLLSKSYLASFFEIIRCDCNFETAQKCIEILENFFVPQEIYC